MMAEAPSVEPLQAASARLPDVLRVPAGDVARQTFVAHSPKGAERILPSFHERIHLEVSLESIGRHRSRLMLPEAIAVVAGASGPLYPACFATAGSSRHPRDGSRIKSELPSERAHAASLLHRSSRACRSLSLPSLSAGGRRGARVASACQSGMGGSRLVAEPNAADCGQCIGTGASKIGDSRCT